MRREWGLVAGAAVVVIAGCNTRANEGAAGPTGSRATGGTALKVARVTDTGGIEDQSFNAGAWEGLKRAQQELSIPKPRYRESKELADYKTNLSSLAEQKNELVIAGRYMS